MKLKPYSRLNSMHPRWTLDRGNLDPAYHSFRSDPNCSVVQCAVMCQSGRLLPGVLEQICLP